MSNAKLGFAIIGSASHHYEFISNALIKTGEATLLGVFDENQLRGRRAAARLGTHYYSDLDNLLRSENLDLGIVTAENAYKKKFSISLARSGKHVFSDKPLGATAGETREVVAECTRAKVALLVAYVSRYLRQAQLTKEYLSSGKLGKIRFIKAENRIDMGLVKILSPWLLNKGPSGGGALLEHAVHVIDLALWFNGNIAVRSVYATKAKNLDESCQGEDNFVIVMRFENGSIATVDGSYCRASSGRSGDIVVDVYGQKGNIEMYSHNLELKEYLAQEPKTIIRSLSRDIGTSDSQNSAEMMARDMLKAIRTGATPLASGEAAERVNRVVDAAYTSIKSGSEEKI